MNWKIAMLAGTALAVAAPAWADPPHWAPAHGWRAQHGHAHYQYAKPKYVRHYRYVPVREVVVVHRPRPVRYEVVEVRPSLGAVVGAAVGVIIDREISR